MKCDSKNWVPTQIDYEGFDWEHKPITLHNVPAESCPICGEIRIDADILSVYEQKKVGEMLNLTPTEMAIMWFLYSPGPRFTKRGYVEQKYRFNKMLFYLWKRLEKIGFGESLIHDTFECEQRGPVPVHLLKTTRSLEEKKLIKVQLGGKKEKQSYKWELTEKGDEIAEALWKKTPDVFKEKVIEVKKELFLIDTTQLMHKVHKEYPEYRRVYTKEDKE